ncbi:hypothetical protein HZ996_08065 [Cryomorphaceae bacterium]|nr:hypothetical protein HZ996_08065 [Cryomorphaceae bacterium]
MIWIPCVGQNNNRSTNYAIKGSHVVRTDHSGENVRVPLDARWWQEDQEGESEYQRGTTKAIWGARLLLFGLPLAFGCIILSYMLWWNHLWCSRWACFAGMFTLVSSLSAGPTLLVQGSLLKKEALARHIEWLKSEKQNPEIILIQDGSIEPEL